MAGLPLPLSALPVSSISFCVHLLFTGITTLYGKIVEVQQQVLFLTKMVQRSLASGQCGSDGGSGSYSLPAGIVLPLDTARAVTETEHLLADRNTRREMVQCLDDV